MIKREKGRKGERKEGKERREKSKDLEDEGLEMVLNMESKRLLKLYDHIHARPTPCPGHSRAPILGGRSSQACIPDWSSAHRKMRPRSPHIHWPLGYGRPFPSISIHENLQAPAPAIKRVSFQQARWGDCHNWLQCMVLINCQLGSSVLPSPGKLVAGGNVLKKSVSNAFILRHFFGVIKSPNWYISCWLPIFLKWLILNNGVN